MYKTDTPSIISHTRSARTECCADPDCGSGLRNNYFDGKRLTPDTFRVEHQYLVERRRLLNRAIHGWGVVYGYGVSLDTPPGDGRESTMPRLAIKAGLALDECGRELVELGADPIELADLILLDDKGHPIDRENVSSPSARTMSDAFQSAERLRPVVDAAKPLCLQLSVHYAEQDRDPVQTTDSCRCKSHEWDHVCETVRYTLRLISCEDCCQDYECGLNCDCTSLPCCHSERNRDEKRNNLAATSEKANQERLPADAGSAEILPGRGGCRCLCDHLTKLNPGAGCGTRLCEIGEKCGRVRVDLKHGVPLACLKFTTVRGRQIEVEGCGRRRLVKRNDLLFDLIRGCDLTRIIEIGWAPWHGQEVPVDFDAFSAAFGQEDPTVFEYVTSDFWVRFSRPVRWETLRPDCFAITILSSEEEGGWWKPFRVPIISVDFEDFPPETGDPPNHARGAKIVVDGDWVEDALRGAARVFERGETRIEIEVRGDFIIDCNGQPVDANAIGRSAARTGNGTPGGTFMSAFTVGQASDSRDRKPKHGNRDRLKGVSS